VEEPGKEEARDGHQADNREAENANFMEENNGIIYLLYVQKEK
jgi:hypothetical protein